MKTRKIEKAEIAALVTSADNEIRLAQRNIGYNVREWTVELIVQKYGNNLETDKNELLFLIINAITNGISKQPLDSSKVYY
ncbi:hypothetical protein ACVV4E_02950 [Escherichia coli]